MRRALAGLVLSLSTLAACAARHPAAPVDGSGVDAGGVPGHDAGSAPHAPPGCVRTCSAAADCAQGTSGISDADNYACNAGRCAWNGCRDDAECMTTFGADGHSWTCDTSSSPPGCVRTCSSASDCAQGTSGISDADNYTCNAGRCAWNGCRDDAECMTTFGADGHSWTCDTSSSPPGCVRTCSSASDCAQGTGGISDADNYTCNAGRCAWIGCRDASECMTSFGADGHTWTCEGP